MTIKKFGFQKLILYSLISILTITSEYVYTEWNILCGKIKINKKNELEICTQ